jgi:hypothetical protein
MAKPPPRSINVDHENLSRINGQVMIVGTAAWSFLSREEEASFKFISVEEAEEELPEE